MVITLADAHLIAGALARTQAHRGALREKIGEDASATLGLIHDRLNTESGADVEEIVRHLKDLAFCPACRIEAQERHCSVLEAQKQGRRLRRLLERARGTRRQQT